MALYSKISTSEKFMVISATSHQDYFVVVFDFAFFKWFLSFVSIEKIELLMKSTMRFFEF